MQPPKRQNRESGSEVIPRAVRCSAVQCKCSAGGGKNSAAWESLAQRNARSTDEQTDDAGVGGGQICYSLRSLRGGEKEGGRRWPNRARWCCAQDRPWTWATFDGPLFRLAQCDRFAFCVLSLAVVCCDVVHRGVMFQDEREREREKSRLHLHLWSLMTAAMTTGLSRRRPWCQVVAAGVVVLEGAVRYGSCPFRVSQPRAFGCRNLNLGAATWNLASVA